MHVEPLEKLPRSVREFLSHYAMIVLSILTALALEQAVVAIEHHHQGERARHEIEQEIEANRVAVRQSLVVTRDYATTWDAMLARTVTQFKAGQGTNESLLATLAEAHDHYGDAMPGLKTAAWDAALSDHAVDYLEHEEVTRYADLYAAQRFFSQALWDIVRDNLSHSLSDVSLPQLLGKADAVATITTLNTRVRTLRIMESQLVQMDRAMAVALKADAVPEPGSASTASAASR
jgi:hypothetical protein